MAQSAKSAVQLIEVLAIFWDAGGETVDIELVQWRSRGEKKNANLMICLVLMKSYEAETVSIENREYWNREYWKPWILNLCKEGAVGRESK